MFRARFGRSSPIVRSSHILALALASISLGRFRGHFGASGLPGQYFDLVEIQSMASASVAKSPMWESGPFPVFTATNQRPSLIISGWN
jgi:hypothetical protein